MPVPKFPSFLGFGKEATPGTAVAPTTFLPVTDMTPENVPNYVADTAMRGSAVVEYDEIPTQQWATYGHGGPVFLDSIGVLLKAIFGGEAVTGTGAYTHLFSVLNSGTFQPPTYTLSDYNGYQAKSWPFGMCSQVEFTFGADGLLTYTATWSTFPSQNVATPSKSYSTVRAQAAYKTAVTIGGVASTRTLSATITLSRAVNPIVGLNGLTVPLALYAGAFSVAGSINNLYNDDTDLTALTSGTRQAVDLTLTDTASSSSLDLHFTSNLFTAGPINRGSDYMTLPLTLKPVANTTDVGASGGYGPATATLVNAVSTVY